MKTMLFSLFISLFLAVSISVHVSAAGDVTWEKAATNVQNLLNVDLAYEDSTGEQLYTQSIHFDGCTMIVKQIKSRSGECSLNRIHLAKVDFGRIALHGADIFTRSLFKGADCSIEMVRRKSNDVLTVYDCNNILQIWRVKRVVGVYK